MSTTSNHQNGKPELGATSGGGNRQLPWASRDFIGEWWRSSIAWLENFDRRKLAWWSLAVAAVLAISVNVIASNALRNASADLTQGGLFTISDGTRKVLAGLQEPVKVRVYFSKALGEAAPVYQKYFVRVRALLEQYRDLSAKRLDLEFIDPEPFSDAEDRAVARGLKGVRLNREGETGYFGLLATNTTDHQSVIEFFTPERERFLEYDLTKLIYGLSNPKKRVIGLVTALPLEGSFNPRGGMVPPWLVMEQMRDFFDVKALEVGFEEVPADVDILMVVQPDVLPEKSQYAIDQFALKGGRILAFVDPIVESAQRNPQMPALPPTGFDKLFKAWGVDFDGGKVAGDIRAARKVQFGGGGGRQPVVADYVGWVSYDKKYLDDKDVLSAGIERLTFATPGFLAKAKDAKITFTPLVTTSADAMAISADNFGPMPDPAGLLRNYKPGGKPLVLAARLSGEVATAFPAGKPKDKDAAEAKQGADEDKAKQAKQPAEKAVTPQPGHVAKGKLNAIVIADADMLYDQFWADVRDFLGQKVVTPTSHNVVLALNALDNLSGSDTMMGLRARGIDDRPFERVEQIRRDAERRFRDKERSLQTKLTDLQKQLSTLETKGDGKVVVGDKDRQAIEKFRGEMVGVRRDLREVKRALRADIDRLDGWVKAINIAGVPVLIGLGALVFGWMRRRNLQSAG